MNRAEHTERVVFWEQAAKECMAEAGRHRTELQTAANREWEEEKSAVSWRNAYGDVVLPVSKTSIVVSDPHAFTKWVADLWPGQIETRVRQAFAELLLKRFVIEEDGTVVDPKGGEVVPGVQVQQGGTPQSLRITPDADAKAIARQRAGVLVQQIKASAGGEDQ